MKAATVDTDQSTTSTSYTDLATSGPAVTVVTGTTALVIVYANTYNGTLDKYNLMSFAVSGATTLAASDDRAGTIRTRTVTDGVDLVGIIYYATLTAGSNTFTAKYKTDGGTANFRRRRIVVIPL